MLQESRGSVEDINKITKEQSFAVVEFFMGYSISFENLLNVFPSCFCNETEGPLKKG